MVLGAGGLGCPAALALRQLAPRLRIRIVDPDRIERSNLARQILFAEEDLGAAKAEVASRKVAAEPRVARFEPGTAAALLRDADVLLDGTDDFPTRFLANDEAVGRGLPLVHGAVLGWTGQLLTVLPGKSACLRCLFEGPPAPGALPTCAEAGVAAPLCGVVGAKMAQAAIAVLEGNPRAGILDRWDGRRGTSRPLELRQDPACVCRGARHAHG